ncbi:M15 family metallopeptidase [Clostridium intestinale]|uniref:M15 family metallopeptidase n=1 Tax=Clostridium intestinale TaxID=36845 RepID=UPI0028F12E87|nr:M15 family metallopeptidase [Clostridium intestinale]
MRKICSLILILSVTVNLFVVSCNKNIKSDKTAKVVEEINIDEEQDFNEVESKKDVDISNEIKNEEQIEEPKEINGFVLLKEMDKDFLIDLRYATENNFTKQKVYPNDICVLRKDTAVKLVKANEEFKKLGYRIKIWDAYRPVYVQRIFWNIVKDSRFVANPDNGGSIHNKGCAVDITLVDKEGKELMMPSSFDDFSEKAYRGNTNMSDEAKSNMTILTNIMVQSGFKIIDTEWWHFDDTDSGKYNIEDVDLNLFLN